MPYYTNPVHKDADQRRKILRKELLAGIAGVLTDVAKYNPR